MAPPALLPGPGESPFGRFSHRQCKECGMGIKRRTAGDSPTVLFLCGTLEMVVNSRVIPRSGKP